MQLDQEDRFTHFNHSKAFRDLTSFAIRAHVIEPSDLVAFVIDHELYCRGEASEYDRLDSSIGAFAGWQDAIEKAVVDKILFCAYQGRHCPGGQDIHAVLSRKADKYFADR